jgi:hypothetical protein
MSLRVAHQGGKLHQGHELLVEYYSTSYVIHSCLHSGHNEVLNEPGLTPPLVHMPGCVLAKVCTCCDQWPLLRFSEYLHGADIIRAESQLRAATTCMNTSSTCCATHLTRMLAARACL